MFLFYHEKGKYTYRFFLLPTASNLTIITYWANLADENWWYFSEKKKKKIGFDLSCKLSPQETICTKGQSLFSGKNKKNILKCCMLKFLPCLLSVKFVFQYKTIEEKPVKIDKWDTAALKNALDDAAKKVGASYFSLEKQAKTTVILCRPRWLSWMRVRLGTSQGRQHSFMEIDHEIISIYGYYLPFSDSRRAVVSLWQKNVHNTG